MFYMFAKTKWKSSNIITCCIYLLKYMNNYSTLKIVIDQFLLGDLSINWVIVSAVAGCKGSLWKETWNCLQADFNSQVISIIVKS